MAHRHNERGARGEKEAADVQQNAQDIEQDIDGPNGASVGGNGLEAEAPVRQERDLAAEYLDALQRERASFINFKRRTEQERAEMAQRASSAILKKLLPVIDDFDRALAAIPEAERENNRWVEGVELIARKLHNVLDSEGVEPMEALGQPFDPNLHEAVAFEDNTEADSDHVDRVSEVFQKGYMQKDRVLRPAMVKVTRG